MARRRTWPGSGSAARIAKKDKASISLTPGQAIDLRASDVDYLPLSAGIAILGCSFTGRSMATVRDQEGLTYDIGAGLSGLSLMEGGFVVKLRPAPAGQGHRQHPPRAGRLMETGRYPGGTDARKDGMLGRRQVAMQTTGQMAAMLAHTVLQDQPLSDLTPTPSVSVRCRGTDRRRHPQIPGPRQDDIDASGDVCEEVAVLRIAPPCRPSFGGVVAIAYAWTGRRARCQPRPRNNRRGFAAPLCENRSHRSLPSTQRGSHDHPHHDRIHRARSRSHR